MWNLKVIDVNKPVYLAIADALERDIRAGILKPGDRLPTHRSLAEKVGVAVTTTTKAYKEAERRNLITAVVGSGTFITSDCGKKASMHAPELSRGNNIEMGLVWPLHAQEEGFLARVLAELANSPDLAELMGYASPGGLPGHRRVAANWLKKFGLNVQADEVIITSGSQHAVSCALSALFEPGDRLAVDNLTYPGVKVAARRYGLLLEGVPIDAEGMNPAELKKLCRRCKIKGLYLTSGMQYPTNQIMSARRAADLAQLAEKQDLTVIEDGCYGFLAEKPGKVLSAAFPENSVYIAGISKAFYAGLRVAFLAGPRHLNNRLTQAVVDSVWMASPLCAEVACRIIESGAADKIIRKKRKELDRRADLIKKTLSAYDYRLIRYSMFAWIRLPDYWTGPEFEKAAYENGVNVIAADKFTVGAFNPPGFIRLSLTGAADHIEFKRGLDIVKKLLDRELGGLPGVL